MIAPLIPFSIRGAFWYQGESNEARAQQYEILLPVMIKAWRERWREGDFPFGISATAKLSSIQKMNLLMKPGVTFAKHNDDCAKASKDWINCHDRYW